MRPGSFSSGAQVARRQYGGDSQTSPVAVGVFVDVDVDVFLDIWQHSRASRVEGARITQGVTWYHHRGLQRELRHQTQYSRTKLRTKHFFVLRFL